MTPDRMSLPVNIIPNAYELFPNRKFIYPVSGFVVHAISEYIHSSALSQITDKRDYYRHLEQTGKKDPTLIKKFDVLRFPEWIHHTEWLHLNCLSIQYFAEPNGDIQLGVDGIAWHAGMSEWNGLNDLNNHFVGIEVVVSGKLLYHEFINKMKTDWVTEPQYYSTLKALEIEIQKPNNRIVIENVVRHSDISPDSVRGKGKGKQDPSSGFPWERFKADAKLLLK